MNKHIIDCPQELVPDYLSGKIDVWREKIEPIQQPDDGAYFDIYHKGPQWNWWSKDNKVYLHELRHQSFMVGDELWMRDAWAYFWGAGSKILDNRLLLDENWGDQEEDWQPSSEMPKEFIRLKCTITGVSVVQIDNDWFFEYKLERIEDEQ